MSAWPGWDAEVLIGIGAPVNSQGLRLMDAWHVAEGSFAAFNPLNTTQPEAGTTDYNSVGVKNYPTKDVGLRATVTALENGRYDGIVNDLRAGSFTAEQVLTRNAAEFAVWGTGASHIYHALGGNLPTDPLGAPPNQQGHLPAAWAHFMRELGRTLPTKLRDAGRISRRYVG